MFLLYIVFFIATAYSWRYVVQSYHSCLLTGTDIAAEWSTITNVGCFHLTNPNIKLTAIIKEFHGIATDITISTNKTLAKLSITANLGIALGIMLTTYIIGYSWDPMFLGVEILGNMIAFGYSAYILLLYNTITYIKRIVGYSQHITDVRINLVRQVDIITQNLKQQQQQENNDTDILSKDIHGDS